MKKNLFLLAALAVSLAFTSCSKDDDKNDNSQKEYTTEEAQNLDYTSDNARAWGNYAANVAKLLQEDAQTLYNKWNGGYAAAFKAHNGESTDYTSAESCIEQIIDGCVDIANEVGESKIGGPYDSYKAGNTQEALYAVESWYSWHSRDDYKNNILSIANSLVGKRLENDPSEYDYRTLAQNVMAGTATFGDNIMEQCMKAGYVGGNSTLMQSAIKVWTLTLAAWTAIDNIQQPFRNNIGSTEAKEAMDACAELVDGLKALKNAIGQDTTIDWDPTVAQFVDVVAVPTYKDLADKAKTLYNAVYAFQANPSDAAFQTACNAWLSARQPWETSEAFLFGPVSELGLDPNMDSWPLDAIGIANLLQSQNWSAMNWSGEYEEMDEDDEDASSDQAKAIAAAQSVRGFHTLEFLLFKDGQARKVK